MSHNWNVYKLFSNGKRAKYPYCSFEYEDENTVQTYFMEKVKANFKEKFLKANYKLVRADRVQARESDAEERKSEELRMARERKIKHILSTHLAAKGIGDDQKLVGGLMYSVETKWKWQWTASTAANNKFVIGLSPKFDKEGDATQWLEKQLDKN